MWIIRFVGFIYVLLMGVAGLTVAGHALYLHESRSTNLFIDNVIILSLVLTTAWTLADLTGEQ